MSRIPSFYYIQPRCWEKGTYLAAYFFDFIHHFGHPTLPFHMYLPRLLPSQKALYSSYKRIKLSIWYIGTWRSVYHHSVGKDRYIVIVFLVYLVYFCRVSTLSICCQLLNSWLITYCYVYKLHANSSTQINMPVFYHYYRSYIFS